LETKGEDENVEGSQFHCGTRIVMGNQVSKQIPGLFAEHFPDRKRIMIVSDKGLVNLGLINPILQDLEQAGYIPFLYDQVSQNPRDTECLQGAALFKENKINLVVGIGGGSPIDTAKAIALLGPNGGEPLDYYQKKRVYKNIAPIVCIPTTAGTGSEVTRSSVITVASTHQKITLKHESLRPALAILDPELTYSLPPDITAATGVDALVHAIEGFTCKVSNPVSKALGATAMQLIIQYLPQAYCDGTNREARSKMLEASLLAGMCFGSADVAAVHCLAEGLGSLYDTPHGVANSVFLPYVIDFNAKANITIHAEISKIMKFAEETDSNQDAVEKLVKGIKKFTDDLGIPRLKELPKVNEKDFKEIVHLAYTNNSTSSNVREVTPEDYKEILYNAYAEKVFV
jgi:alcohol dehydrogenase class IV